VLLSRQLLIKITRVHASLCGPRGAPYTFVTTRQFLVHFGLESLRDLPDVEQLRGAGDAPEDI
jgi:chromosome segregation and condensation protein ScpB